MRMSSVFDMSTQTQRHWPAYLSLGFDKPGDKTRMKQMEFQGPLRVQRPFYPESDVCHVYLLHPPGGLVSGDDLSIQIQCQPQSHALITTPSAGKIYKADSNGIEQKQHVDIEVDNAVCEWMPMETIVFDGAHGKLTTQVNLFGDAKFVGLDVFCLGRPKVICRLCKVVSSSACQFIRTANRCCWNANIWLLMIRCSLRLVALTVI